MKTIAAAFDRPVVRGFGATIIFAALTAALAQVAFRLPFTPVPVTLQVLGVILSGLLLGSRRGAIAQLEYLAAGLAGAPVFAGYSGGIAALLGPSGGYLPGFAAGAFMSGLLFERCGRPDVRCALIAGAAGVAVIYLCGASWLATWLALAGASSPMLLAWQQGVAPFVGVDALKVAVAAGVATGSVRWQR